MAELYTVNRLAEAFDVDRRTVRKRLQRAGVKPAEVDGRERRFDLAQAAPALVEPQPAASPPRTSDTLAADLLEALALPQELLLPWDHEEVVPLDTYREELGLKPRDFAELVLYGLPILPPAEGEKVARVSRPHAERWRTLFAGHIEQLGGDGQAVALGSEAARLRGLEEQT